ncbi:hypothetical protein ACFYO8_13265 [Micromonospora sp. NPDC005257]|uniref:hypothetical protein n=1 Tax=Micromonospora sp. NPDC005257 TaxID=3364230 RepID=UPI0036D0C760
MSDRMDSIRCPRRSSTGRHQGKGGWGLTLTPDRNRRRNGRRGLLAAALSIVTVAGTVTATAAPAAAYDIRYEIVEG